MTKPPVYLIVGSQKPTWHIAESFRLKESKQILANTRTWATSPEWVQTNIIYHPVPWFENINISAFNAEKLPCNSTVQSPYLLKPHWLDVSFCKSVIFFLQNRFYTFLSFRTQPSTSRKKRLPKISCSLAPKSTPFWTTPGTLEIQRQSSRPDSMEGGYYGGSTMPNVWNGILDKYLHVHTYTYTNSSIYKILYICICIYIYTICTNTYLKKYIYILRLYTEFQICVAQDVHRLPENDFCHHTRLHAPEVMKWKGFPDVKVDEGKTNTFLICPNAVYLYTIQSINYIYICNVYANNTCIGMYHVIIMRTFRSKGNLTRGSRCFCITLEKSLYPTWFSPDSSSAHTLTALNKIYCSMASESTNMYDFLCWIASSCRNLLSHLLLIHPSIWLHPFTQGNSPLRQDTALSFFTSNSARWAMTRFWHALRGPGCGFQAPRRCFPASKSNLIQLPNPWLHIYGMIHLVIPPNKCCWLKPRTKPH